MFHGVKSSQLWGSWWAPVGTCAFPLPGESVYLKGKSLVLGGAGGGNCTEIVLSATEMNPLCEKQSVWGDAYAERPQGTSPSSDLPGKQAGEEERRGDLFTKQSIFIHLYLLNEKKKRILWCLSSEVDFKCC